MLRALGFWHFFGGPGFDVFWFELEPDALLPTLQADQGLRVSLLGGSWVVIGMAKSPLIWVITIVALLITPLSTTHEPPSKPPKPSTRNPQPQALSPKPSALNPKP